MRKITFLLAAVLFMLQYASAQQAERDMVVFEIFTGVNCPYCPAAANGAYDMLDAGLDVAVAAYHNPTFSIAQFYTPETTARTSYYAVGSWPTTKVDGILNQSGGGGSGQSNYGAYVNLYNQRISVMSDFTIDLDWENVTDDDYEVMVTVEKVGTGTYNNLKLIVDLCESDINYSWYGMDKLSFVTRDMIPTQNGTTLDFSGGNIIELTLPFTMPAGVVRNNCELIAFVQNFTGKEILQGTKKTMRVADFAVDAELFNVANIPAEMCTGLLEPEVEIKNMGAEVLTTLNINFEVNGELIETYAWNGNLEFYESEMIEIPEFTFANEDDNEIVVYISDPNGGTDENPDNNSQTFNTTLPVDVEDMLVLIMKTDDQPQQTSWKVFDANGNMVDEGGPYTQAQLFFKDTVFYESPGCHQFVMYDAGGNGLSTYYTLRSFIGGTITSIKSGGAFGYKESTHFNVLMDGINANFTMDENEGCEELTVNFQDDSFGNVTSWAWEFEGGDPATSTDENPTVFYNTPGVYDVTLEVSDGTNNSTFTNDNCIEVFELPEVIFSSIDDMCVYWPEQELMTGSPTGGEYSGPGVVDGFFYPETAGTGTHTLMYTYEDANGCENYAEQTVYVDDCVGIDDPTATIAMQVYPNPMTNSSIVSFNLNDNADVKISLFNNLGMEVLKVSESYMNAGTHKVNLNLSGYENGIYFIRIQAGTQIHTEKVTLVK